MLKNIHLHVDSDESRQHALEQQAAQAISQRQRENLNAIRRYMPSLFQYIPATTQSSVSVMCNKYGELNIVDYQNGRVLYGEHPYEEAHEQLKQFAAFPLRVDLQLERGQKSAASRCFLQGMTGPTVEGYRQSCPLPANIDGLVVLGLGLGYQVEQILQQYRIEHLIIYEPNLAYFRCSINSMNWKTFLELAKEKDTNVYLQIGKDGSELAANMEELAENFPLKGFYLLQHYPQNTFNQVSEKLAEEGWQGLKNWTVDSREILPTENYLSVWQFPVNRALWSAENLNHDQFAANLEAFKRYFPAIYDQFHEYNPEHWVPMASASGEVNVFHKETLKPLYGPNPSDDCRKSFEGFAERPNKDSLVLSYSGEKLKPYLHYQLVDEVQAVLSEIEESKGEMPSTIRSMILFGLGVGYQLPYIFDKYEVEKLFICEPNRDYFYASLFAVDWTEILKIADESGARIYLNIGDDGSNLIRDLLQQFHTIGPYFLANTFFYQGYYNINLVNAIAELREQLQLIISMGEYFDHSRYDFAHTEWAIENKVPFLKNNASKFLSEEMKETPVFIVGNGPSLDSLLPLIKEHEEQAIIISCGTALQSLYRNGITPDFHAEIEINRSTFDWAVRIGDFSYLKKISLISCNGMHPDTCNLYKNVFLAFKAGESATVSTTELYPNNNWKLLEKSYPTVTNFAADFMTSVGFQQIYLCGVDMGFVDKEHHHSKSSGYYQDGKPLYDYSSVNNTSLVIPGNFRPYVNTKYEFKISKSMLEQVFIDTTAEVYNMNDGAKILGSIPLPPDNLLILSSAELKRSTKEKFLDSCFEVTDFEVYHKLREARFSHTALCQELDEFSNLLTEVPATRNEVEMLIQKQRDFIVSSYRKHSSSLYFYLVGTVNYINSALSMTLNVADDEARLQTISKLHDAWKKIFQEIKSALETSPSHFDFISSYPGHRREQFYREFFIENVKFAIEPPAKSKLNQFIFKNVTQEKEVQQLTSQEQRLEIWFIDAEPALLSKLEENACAQPDCLIVEKEATLLALLQKKLPVPIVYLPGHFLDKGYPVDCNDIRRVVIAACASFEPAIVKVILPKINLHPSSKSVSELYDLSLFEQYQAYFLADCIWLTENVLTPDQMYSQLGDRLMHLAKLKPAHLIASTLSQSEYDERKAIIQSLLQK